MAWLIDRPDRFAVSQRAFVDPEVWRREQRAVFDRTWLYVAHASEVKAPGDFVTRRIAGRSLIVVRGDDGVVRVLRNSCRHRGTEVCWETAGQKRTFTCPYHGWTYALDGRRVRPADTGLGLEAPRTDAYRDFVFVAFDPALPPLADWLGEVREWLDAVCDQGPDGMEVVGAAHRYRVEADWKLFADNSVDIAHVATLHPRYLASLRAAGTALMGAQNPGGIARASSNGHAVVEYDGPWGRVGARWSPEHGAAARGPIEAARAEILARAGARVADLSRNLLVYPNLVINDLMAVTVRVLHPLGPGRTEIHAWQLAPKGEDERLRAVRTEQYLGFFGPAGLAHADDVAVVEAGQRGFDPLGTGWSDYSRGGERPADEAHHRGFWRMWARQMGPP